MRRIVQRPVCGDEVWREKPGWAPGEAAVVREAGEDEEILLDALELGVCVYCCLR